MRQVIDRAFVDQWLAGYETAWRAPGTENLTTLFTSDAVYLQSPVTGLDRDLLRPGPDAITSYPFVTLDWSRRWPCEEVWKARKSS